MERDAERPDLRLESELKKVGTTLSGYAEGLGKTKEELTILEICLSNEVLHPALERCPTVLDQGKEYRGQNLSRIRKLVKNLAWSDESDGDNQIAIEEHLPDHLRKIWCLFSRVSGRAVSKGKNEEDLKAYYEYHATLPLSQGGMTLVLALLRVSVKSDVTDNRRLFEDFGVSIQKDIKSHNTPDKWDSLLGSFHALRREVREYLDYQVERPSRITPHLEELPEPLRTQVLTFERRAREGFGEDVKIKMNAMRRYKLELDTLAPKSILLYTEHLLLGMGHIPRETYGETLDIKDFLKLEERKVEEDGIDDTESYNPLVEIYRVREAGRSSTYKDEGYDSVSFRTFIEAIAAVAAYNGFLNLRKKFLNAYSIISLDTSTKVILKERKKEVFNLEWLDVQIELLGVKFHEIAESGSFRYSKEGILSRRARRDLNLCLFYVALVTLRFLGVRQQSVRDCVVGENVKFGKKKSVTFEWKTEEVKNGKGLKHILSMEEHDLVLGTLIDAVWTYFWKIYPYITGGDDYLPREIMAAQRAVVAGQFFLTCGTKMCHPFKDMDEFAAWFQRRARCYLDIGDKLGEEGVRLHPHLLSALYGDWLRFLGFSKEQTAEMAGDDVVTFERDYLSRQKVYDATPAWTAKNKELRARREAVKVRGKAAGVNK
jgi:hypothetical protein